MCVSQSAFKIRTLSVKLSGLDTVDKRFLAVHHILIWQGGNRIQRVEAGAL